MRSTLTLLMPHTGSLLADQQNKHSDSYQQGKQNTDDERHNRMATGLDLFRSSAILRCSDAQPEEKLVHRAIPRSEPDAASYQNSARCCRRRWLSSTAEQHSD